MGNLFTTAAELEYNATMGGLPMIIFVIIFIVSSISITFTKTEEDETKNYGPLVGIIGGLMITLIFYIGDYIRKSWTNASIRVLKKEGIKNAKSTVYLKRQIPSIYNNL